MANELDEMRDEVLEEGRDVNVINKQLTVTVGSESQLFELGVWVIPVVVGLIFGLVLKGQYGVAAIPVCMIIGLIPGIAVYVLKIKAANYLLQLQQKLQHDASQIDNYLEQRVVILKNAAKILEKGINLDKETFTKIAELRSGNIESTNDTERNELAADIDSISRNINVAFESYPELKAHHELEDAMQQNSYLQREITAAREVYNDAVLTWNREIFEWPIKKIVAAKKGYTTRIPFATTQETKKEAKEVLF